MPREQKGVSKPKSRKVEPYCFFVIASEGANTERIYFEGLNKLIQEQGSRTTIKIEFLERKENERHKSHSKDVIKQLDNYKKNTK